jgi:hypothetical protein
VVWLDEAGCQAHSEIDGGPHELNFDRPNFFRVEVGSVFHGGFFEERLVLGEQLNLYPQFQETQPNILDGTRR